MATSQNVGSLEASEILGVDRATFLRWVAKGLTPWGAPIEPVHENPGPVGAKVFRRADVEQLAREKAEAAS